jgi:Excreted virulence factor EspC, type VII ESX diderm
MGEQDSAHVDIAAVRAAADQFDAAAEQLDRAAHVPLSFDGSTAGRAHAPRGDAVRVAADWIPQELSAWARAAAEIAACLRAGANRYVDADFGATARFT